MPSATQEDSGAQSETQTSSRLYISPLNQTLTKTVLTPTQQAVATNISYHTIPTFPEKGYGYVELPVEEAQKLRKKFNGSILRGMKVRAEEAKPESKKRKAKEEAERAPSAAEKESRKAKKAKKEKLEDGVLSGIALPGGREVKRGWVQPSASEKKEKSKSKKSSTADKSGKKEKSQMIFRTTVPLNVVASTTDAEVKKRKDKKKKRKHEGEKAGLATEVQEFTHSTKFPTFLRGGQVMGNDSKATEFVEGKGWVDAAGEVVESVKIRPQRRVTAPPEQSVPKKKNSKKATLVVEDSSDLSESSSDPSSESDDEDEDEAESVSEDELEEEALDKAPDALKPSRPVSNDNPTPSQPEDAAVIPPTSTPPPAELAAPKPIHPLEALYKRSTATTAPTSITSTPRPAPILTNFSFFGEDANGEDNKDEDAVTAAPLQDDNLDSVPKTPYTRRDLESRGQRSAAPTPDTAAVGKKAPWLAERDGSGDSDITSSSSSSDDDTSSDEEDAVTTPKASAATQNVKTVSAAAEAEAPPREQTEFEKHFWEKRGEYNRSWKQRKREAKKESRQSENRRRGGGAFAVSRE